MLKKQKNFNYFIKKYIILCRLNKLSAVFLLVLPAFWSLSINIKYSFYNNLFNILYLHVAFLLGALITRSFGCVINDILDRKIDKNIERTKYRPIANGDVSIVGAILCALILGTIGLLILLTFNNFTVILGVIALFLIIIYPITKRFTYYPQVFLGITYAWGCLLAEAALNDYLSFVTIILYVTTILWIIAYDSIYAIQDYKYDKQFGVKSTVVKWGIRTQGIIGCIYIVVLLLLCIIGYMIRANLIYYILLIFVALHFIWQVVSIDFNKPQRCWIIFKYNVYAGFLIWIAFLLG